MGHRLKKKERPRRVARGNEALSKGQIISNCGAMHLNWERLSLSGYFEALEAHNASQAPDAGKGAKLDSAAAERLARFNKAHGVG